MLLPERFFQVSELFLHFLRNVTRFGTRKLKLDTFFIFIEVFLANGSVEYLKTHCFKTNRWNLGLP